MDEYAAAKHVAEEILKDKKEYVADLVNLSECFLKLHALLKPTDQERMLGRLHNLRNHTLEQAAVSVERLTGRKRGEINRESAEYIRRLKVK